MSVEIKQSQKIKFHIQDVEYTVAAADVSPSTSLNSYIRNTLQLFGTKSLCYEGGCGSCIVVIYSQDSTGKDIYLAVNSCLVPVLSCNGWKIYTIEGIGDPVNGYHLIQETLAQFNGTQCGFCSPGMVMNMYALYQSGKLTMKEVENSFAGNICRCTGYRPILSAFKSLCTDASKELLGTYPDIEDLKVCKKAKCEQKCTTKCPNQPVFHKLADASNWYKVYTLADVLTILGGLNNQTYTLVGGNTAQGVFDTYGGSTDIYIDVSAVAELKVHEVVESTFVLGASTTLTEALDIFTEIGAANPQFSYFSQLASHIDLVANVPVRNVGTIAGNLIMKHDNHDFPSDVFLIFETVGAIFTVVGVDGQQVQLSPSEFIDYDMTLKVLQNITFPSYSADTVKFVSYKIMPRAQSAHAHVNAGFLFTFASDGTTLDAASVVYGNINPTFIHAKNTEALLAGKNLFDNDTLQSVFATLQTELVADVIPPDPTPEFRKQLAIALFYKAVLSLASADQVSPQYQSGGTILERPISSGVQDFETNESLYPLTQPIPKIEALAQTSGQAQYLRDIPDNPHQLYGALILAEAAPNSTIISIDASEALARDGIEAFYSAQDIPGENSFTPLSLFNAAEEIFCSGRVLYYQQPVGILVGTSQGVVMGATGLVKITYQSPAEGPLLNVRQILAAGRTDRLQEIRTVEATRRGTDVTRVVTGKFDIYHQFHFHMETQGCVVVPNENGLDIYPTTQWMDQIQVAVASMLQIQNNKINVQVRRLGGAFGAKISRNGLSSCATALAAWKLRRPVRLTMSLSDNMAAVGKRWPLSTDYEVGFNDAGVIQYLTITKYTDLGAVINEIPVDELMKIFMANYISDTFTIHMYIAVTDTANNTWCRAPGNTEGLAAIETLMDHCAYELGMDSLDLRLANFPENSVFPSYVNDLKAWADIDNRKQEIATFNSENRWKKRGMAIVPMTFALNVQGPFTVGVSIYHGDGTVQISHGGIEMGQGMNTKAAQVCAYKLGIPLEKVAIVPSNSFVAPNNLTTGGSVTTEAICYGVIQACDVLLARIQPYKDQLPDGTWEEWIAACFSDYGNLSAIGFCSPNEPNFNSYPIYGLCATEVLMDILTGQHLITRVDIIEDTGQSLSPTIDIGQVEGAFVMGTGYYTMEKIVFNYEGKILTNNTWTYYPPGPKDIPIDFRIKFPKDNPNPLGVLNSKATSEPPLCLSVSVPLAIRNALASARTDAAATNAKWFPFDGTTTVEAVFLNSSNDYTQYRL